MADNKQKSKIVFKGVTPAGLATWAWVDKPDNSEYGKGKYKCSLRLKKGEGSNDQFVRKLIDLHKAAKGKKDTCPVKDGDALAEDNEKKEALRGYWILTSKSKMKPTQVDATKAPLRQSAKSGDLIRLSVAAGEYDTGANKGVTLYLNGLQLLKRLAATGADDFDAVEGFEGDDAPAETAFDDEAPASAPDDEEDY